MLGVSWKRETKARACPWTTQSNLHCSADAWQWFAGVRKGYHGMAIHRLGQLRGNNKFKPRNRGR